jgi:hypothetical protein
MFRSLCVIAVIANNMAAVVAFSPQALPSVTSRSSPTMRATVEKNSMVEAAAAAAASPAPDHAAAAANPVVQGEWR